MSRNPADIGGEEVGDPRGAMSGAIDTADHGMRFWEKQSNALRGTLVARKVVRLDELRRTAEELGERYCKLAYFERTTEALRNLLLEKGLLTEAELERKMDEIRRR